MTALMVRLGMPQTRYRTLHIAGTNGKGSTAAMAAAMLQAAGYRVGLYTSPHLVEFRERIRVNGEMIAESQVAQLTEQLQALCRPDLSPTFFEYTTAMAFQHFADSGVDVAVLEVGLGGRFDATNIVTPMACAITTISLDHQEYLGNTCSAIAFEKAGIIKPAVPVVLGRLEDDAWRTIQQVARERQAPVFRLNEDFYTEGDEPQQFSYRGLGQHYDGLTCALEGRHQLDNAACAVALLGTAAFSRDCCHHRGGASRPARGQLGWTIGSGRSPSDRSSWMARIILLPQQHWPISSRAPTDLIRPALWSLSLG